MSGRYKQFFGQPGATWLAVFGLLGRLPNGMLSLVFVLVTVDATGSYAVAGLAAAMYTVGTGVVNPLWSRAVDRWSARPVLVITGTAQGLALLGVVGLTSDGDAGAALLVTLAASCGALLPPLGAIMRSLWSRIFAGSETKNTAFAYESVVVDIIFVVGPSVVAVLTAAASPGLALIAAAVATSVGSLLVAISPHAARRERKGRGERHWLGPLRYGRVLGLLPVGFLLMGSIVVVELSLVAFADRRGTPGVAGWLIAVLSVGGVVGGLYWGARKQPGTNAQQLVVLLVALAAGWGLLALAGDVWLLAVLLVLAGLVLNPAITAQFSTMDDVAPEAAITESFGWLNTMAAAGQAVGAAVVGLLITESAEPGFLLAAGMCLAACAIAVAVRRGESAATPQTQPNRLGEP